MEVPWLRVKSELQLLATATPDLSCICDLHDSSEQRWILDPLSEARDQTGNLMDMSQGHLHCATTGTPTNAFETLSTVLIIYSHIIKSLTFMIIVTTFGRM